MFPEIYEREGLMFDDHNLYYTACDENSTAAFEH